MKNRQLDKIIDIIASQIKGSNYANKTYVVGGFVRDLLLKNERNDLDFVVNLPQGGVALATYLYKKRLCSRPVIYKRFGTAMVQMKGHKIEFVMTRCEAYQDKSRHPEVDFASLKDDAFRRDFTINSLYYNISNKEVLDVTGAGLTDLKNKIIRSTSDPELIFKEDPLRILRAVRFAGRLNFSIETKTLQGIITWRDHLQYISVERIKDEFVNMILSRGFKQSLKLCYQTQIMEYILPPLIKYQDQVLQLIEKIDSYPPDLTLRLALIAIACNELSDLQTAIIKLTVNKKLVKKAIRIASCVQQLNNYSEINSLNLFVYHNQDDLPQVLQIMQLSFPDFSYSDAIKEKLNLFANKEYPLEGKEIIRKFKLRENKEKNFYIKEAKSIWIENPELGKEDILRLAAQRRGDGETGRRGDFSPCGSKTG